MPQFTPRYFQKLEMLFMVVANLHGTDMLYFVWFPCKLYEDEFKMLIPLPENKQVTD